MGIVNAIFRHRKIATEPVIFCLTLLPDFTKTLGFSNHHEHYELLQPSSTTFDPRVWRSYKFVLH